MKDDQRDEFIDLPHQFQILFIKVPGTTNLVQHHVKLTCSVWLSSQIVAAALIAREGLRDAPPTYGCGLGYRPSTV